jgi:CDP-diacylglycerol---glycerol-3-phosphate 3-phosphatidyltransferase
MANALTTVRLLLVVPFALLVIDGDARSAAFAAVALLVAIATDLLDGAVARRTGTVSALGGTLDHTSDFLFVTCGLFAAASRGAVTWLLPILITSAFIQYVVDSYWIHRRRALRGSRLGRYNGILYFAPLWGVLLVQGGVPSVRPLLTLLVWSLVVSTLVSMTQRAVASRRALAAAAAEVAV